MWHDKKMTLLMLFNALCLFMSHHAGGKKLQEWEKNTLAEKDATIRILYKIFGD